MSFEIIDATRQGVKPLVGFYGKSGGGKTMSALLFARGLVGQAGKLGMIDTENRRGSIFSDMVPGGYKVLNLDAPFSPDRYVEAIVAMEAFGVDCIVIDSMSHSWDGEGGVLDMQEAELQRMAGDNWQKREACKMAAWIKPKMQAKRMIQRILRSKFPVLCCLRGHEKTQIRKENNKTVVERDDFTTPIMDPNFIFEMLCNVECYAKDAEGGYAIIRKITHPGAGACLPKNHERLTIAHGTALAQWCANPGGSKTVNPPAKVSADPKKELLNQLRDATTEIHGWTKALGVTGWQYGKPKLQTWLTDECGFDTLIDAMTVEELRQALVKAEEKLGQGVTP